MVDRLLSNDVRRLQADVTGNAFLKGHRIRIEISSSYYSLYLRNLNTGADNVGLETSHVVARQMIYHDSQRPTHVVLPVIPARNR